MISYECNQKGFAGCSLVDKLCNINTHNMVKGCFSHLYCTFKIFIH